MATNQLSARHSDGTVLGQGADDKIAFYGAAPIPQRANAAQAELTDNSGGTADGIVEALPATQATPAGMTAAERTAIHNNLAEMTAKINEMRSALVAVGLIKGGA